MTTKLYPVRTPPTSRMSSSVPWMMCPTKAAGAISWPRAVPSRATRGAVARGFGQGDRAIHGAPGRFSPRIPPQTPAWYFAGEKDYLREFIAFCRAGAFSIGEFRPGRGSIQAPAPFAFGAEFTMILIQHSPCIRIHWLYILWSGSDPRAGNHYFSARIRVGF